MELKIERVKESIQISIKYAALLATLVFVIILLRSPIIAILLVMKNNCRSTKRIALGMPLPVIAVQLIELLIFAAVVKRRYY
jgi:hypothetical protein